MRGAARIIAIFSLFFSAVCPAQKVQFTSAEKPLILDRMKSIPETNAERAARLKELFIEAGCLGKSLSEQKVEGADSPNIVCTLGSSGDAVIVGAHYERASSPQKPLDNWSGASLLPAIYEALHNRKRSHRFIFVAFADDGNDPAGAEFFVRNLTHSQLEHADAMVNVDS